MFTIFNIKKESFKMNLTNIFVHFIFVNCIVSLATF